MKLGILLCAYDCAEYLDDCINPWIEAAKNKSIVLAAVHGMFAEYKALGQTDNDVDTLNKLKNVPLDFLYIQNSYDGSPEQYQSEAEIRDKALQYLKTAGCDYILLLDADEIWTGQEIDNLFKYIQRYTLYTWFRIEYKNLTFSTKTYTKGFRPPRVFKVKSEGVTLDKFVWDNDVTYVNEKGEGSLYYADFVNRVIPTSVCNPLHYTWLNNERSRKKIEYQKLHFASGAGCSFDWDYETNSLIWNEDYFIQTRSGKPPIFEINVDKAS